MFADRLYGIEGSAIRAILSLLADPEMISLPGATPHPRRFRRKSSRNTRRGSSGSAGTAFYSTAARWARRGY